MARKLVSLGLTILGLCLGSTGIAWAARPFSWAVGRTVAHAEFRAVACPSLRLCVAITQTADIFLSADPIQRRARWVRRTLPIHGQLSAVACASVTECEVADVKGDVIALRIGSRGSVKDSVVRVSQSLIIGIACPAAGLCVAVDAGGDVLTSVQPSQAGSWSLVHVDNSQWYDCQHYGNPYCPQVPFSGVSCASRSRCVAVDGAGIAYTSGDPAGGGATWHPDGGPSVSVYDSVACARNTLCFGACPPGDASGTGQCSTTANYYQATILSFDPTAKTQPPPTFTELSGIEPTSLFCRQGGPCLATGPIGRLFVALDPRPNGTRWQRTYQEPTTATGTGAISGVSCPSSSSCLAVDNLGRILIGSRTKPASGHRRA